VFFPLGLRPKLQNQRGRSDLGPRSPAVFLRTPLFNAECLRAEADVIDVVVDVTGAALHQTTTCSPDVVAQVVVVRLGR